MQFRILNNYAMMKLLKVVFCLLLLSAIIQSWNFDDSIENTDQIQCNIYSENKGIKPKVRITKGKNGQTYYQVSLTNNSSKTDKIDSIEIILRQQDAILENMPLMFGGTCMGRTPIKQTNYLDSQSESGMFLMTKHSEKDYSLWGVLTWNIFMPYLHHNNQNEIVIKAFGENKPIKAGETILFEKFVSIKNQSWQDLMYGFGQEIADEHKIKSRNSYEFKGWSTWDYFGRVYSTKDVTDNIDQLQKEGLDANIIQIDGGWWTERGDYLSVRSNLQGGMKGIADYAKSKGYRAGIHLDGFRADKNSQLYKNHPDWFLKDQDGETICQEIDKKDTYMRYIYFDYSNPAVRDYMKNVLKTIRTEWGFSYFKIDFMRYGLLETILTEHGKDKVRGIKKVTKVNSFDNSMTSIERTRAALKSMREGIGEGFFLACSSVFGPTIGIVDGIRTGGDISPTFEHYKSRCLQNGGNFYLNNTVALADADYLVVRNKEDEEAKRAWGEDKFGGNTTFNEAKMWSNYVALQGGIKINSDNLMTLRKERKDLIKDAFELKTAKRFLPLDFWKHAKNKSDAYNIMLAENEDGVYLSFFNWDMNDKIFAIGGLQSTQIFDAFSNSKINLSNEKLIITAKSHSSMIYKIDGIGFDLLRKNITIE
jgi:alpha-galactosidase